VYYPFFLLAVLNEEIAREFCEPVRVFPESRQLFFLNFLRLREACLTPYSFLGFCVVNSTRVLGRQVGTRRGAVRLVPRKREVGTRRKGEKREEVYIRVL